MLKNNYCFNTYFEKIKNVFKKKFIRNVLTVASGTIMAQALNLLFSPIITRIYDPSSIGTLGIFTSILAIIATVSSLSYPIAIVLPKEDYDASILLKASKVISATTSLLVVITLLIVSSIFGGLNTINDLGNYLFLLPAVMFSYSYIQSLNQWLIRKNKFSTKAKIFMLNVLFLNITKVTLGFIYPVSTTLILTTVVGYIFNAILLQYSATMIIPDVTKKISWKDIKRVLIRYKDFPLFRAPEVLLNTLSQNLPIFLLASFFGSTSVGYYSISLRVLGLPAQLIGQSVGDVLYPRIAQAYNNKENLFLVLRKSTLLLSVIGFIPFGLLFIFGPAVFSYVFGTGWHIAGQYARWLSIWYFFAFINIPSVKLLPVIGQQKSLLIFSLTTIVVRFISLLIGGYYYHNDLLAIVIYSVAGAILNIFLIINTHRKAKLY